jgi:hypothetical protein
MHQAAQNGRSNASASRAATKPPTPNIAEWPKEICPTYPPSQFHASAAAMNMKVRPITLCV